MVLCSIKFGPDAINFNNFCKISGIFFFFLIYAQGGGLGTEPWLTNFLNSGHVFQS